METSTVTVRPIVQHFSDILCVWAYVANARLEHVAERFADRVDFELRFCSVFPDARGKLGASWKDRGGTAGYAEHVRSVARRFDHVEVHPDAWAVVQPRSSIALHQFVKAVELEDPASSGAGVPLGQRLGHRAAWALREAFFRDGRDIGEWAVQAEVAAGFGLDPARIESHLRSGAAAAALESD
ncbi:MAG: DsbA family protein, partial [Devosia sp.]|nr:DsbA family protein [Devosia sp.]